jgi:hypothetical protein
LPLRAVLRKDDWQNVNEDECLEAWYRSSAFGYSVWVDD